MYIFICLKTLSVCQAILQNRRKLVNCNTNVHGRDSALVSGQSKFFLVQTMKESGGMEVQLASALDGTGKLCIPAATPEGNYPGIRFVLDAGCAPGPQWSLRGRQYLLPVLAIETDSPSFTSAAQ
jgi:hypothetical protein